MEHLWAPWRNLYVKNSEKNTAHIFAEIAHGSEDEKNFVLARSKSCFAVLNVYPYNTGHLMIIPYRETGALEDLSEDELLDMLGMLKRMKAAVTVAFNPQGFNVGLNLGAAAGAGIDQHLHVHLVPRWRGDANFMAVTAETRVHPSDLPTVYAQIRQQLGL